MKIKPKYAMMRYTMPTRNNILELSWSISKNDRLGPLGTTYPISKPNCPSVNPTVSLASGRLYKYFRGVRFSVK